MGCTSWDCRLVSVCSTLSCNALIHAYLCTLNRLSAVEKIKKEREGKEDTVAGVVFTDILKSKALKNVLILKLFENSPGSASTVGALKVGSTKKKWQYI